MGRAFNHYFLPNATGTNLLVSNCNVISDAQTICKSNFNSKCKICNWVLFHFLILVVKFLKLYCFYFLSLSLCCVLKSYLRCCCLLVTSSFSFSILMQWASMVSLVSMLLFAFFIFVFRIKATYITAGYLFLLHSLAVG